MRQAPPCTWLKSGNINGPFDMASSAENFSAVPGACPFQKAALSMSLDFTPAMVFHTFDPQN